MAEFVEGWRIVQTLGEGSYGEVKLLVNPITESAVAMKVINLKDPRVKNEVAKEVLIHSMVSTNPAFIKYYGKRQDDDFIYIFLEYVEGGELFDRIVPDEGMPHWQAQKYFLQLIAGVDYLHMKGIAHRDLKPENILLDSHNNLKITDFGMATVFRIKNKERLLNKQCGTIQYVAPEVWLGCYRAEPADIWSCGIILVALLTGELPFNSPTEGCQRYCSYKNNEIGYSPWSRIDTLPLSLIREILTITPSNRIKLPGIMSHRWCIEKIHSPAVTDFNNTKTGNCNNSAFSHSQPQRCSETFIAGNNEPDPSQLHYFSQPTQIDNLLLSTQLLTINTVIPPQGSVRNLVYRMTRFCIDLEYNEALNKLMFGLEKLGYTLKTYANGVVTVTTEDRCRYPLVFKISLFTVDCKTLLDFRLSRGCGLEFKRYFLKIREEILDIKN